MRDLLGTAAGESSFLSVAEGDYFFPKGQLPCHHRKTWLAVLDTWIFPQCEGAGSVAQEGAPEVGEERRRLVGSQLNWGPQRLGWEGGCVKGCVKAQPPKAEQEEHDGRVFPASSPTPVQGPVSIQMLQAFPHSCTTFGDLSIFRNELWEVSPGFACRGNAETTM